MLVRSIGCLMTIVCCGVLFTGASYCNKATSTDYLNINEMKESLICQGVNLEDISLSNSVVTIKFKSKGIDYITPYDIASERAISNEVRKKENKKFIKDLEEIIIAGNGTIMSDGRMNDISTISDFGSALLPKDSLDKTQTKETLQNVLSTNKYQFSNLNITDGVLGGKLASVDITVDQDAISATNDKVREFVSLIEQLNTKDEAGIYQYDLNVYNNNNKQPLVVLSVDYVYQDYMWWQAPELGPNNWFNDAPTPMGVNAN